MYKVELYEKIIEKLQMELNKEYSDGVRLAIENRISHNLQLIQKEKGRLRYTA